MNLGRGQFRWRGVHRRAGVRLGGVAAFVLVAAVGWWLFDVASPAEVESIVTAQPSPHSYPEQGTDPHQALKALQALFPQGPIGPAEKTRDTVRFERWPTQAQPNTPPGQWQHVEDVYPGPRQRRIDFVAAEAIGLSGQLVYYVKLWNITQAAVISRMNEEHCLSPRQRAAVVQVLFGFGQLSYLGAIRDRAGRIGAAFGLDTTLDTDGDGEGDEPTRRDVLVFDQNTGALLSYEQTVPISAATKARPAAVLSFVLFRQCEREPWEVP